MKCPICNTVLLKTESIPRGRRIRTYYKCPSCSYSTFEKGEKIPNNPARRR